MYYNLKIITKDSEFGLESENRTIIEREMDFYFAHIFGASQEFISKIPPIQIDESNTVQPDEIQVKKAESVMQNCENIKPINQIERNKELSETEVLSKTNINIQDKPKPTLTQELPQNINNDLKNTERLNQLNLDNIFSQEKQTQNLDNKEQIVNKEYDNTVDFSEFFDSKTNTGTQSLQSAVENEQKISEKELEKEAQVLFSELQEKVKQQNESEENDNNKENIEIKSDNQVESIKPEFELKNNSDSLINQNVKDEKQNIIEESIVKPEPQMQYKFQDIVDAYETHKNIQIDNEINKQQSFYKNDEKLENVNIKNENSIMPDVNIVSNDIIALNDVEISSEELDIQKDEAVSKDNKPLNNVLLSFDKFLSGFSVNEIHDEFLICASYIKNILKQNDFTMKMINSNLFTATGKIADTTIVDELIQKEYIKTIMVDDFVKYTITPKGEEYLASKLPG